MPTPDRIARWKKLNRDKVNATNLSVRSKRPAVYLVMSKKASCKRSGTLFALDAAWADATYTGFCSLTGLPFEKGGPRTASIDRIDPKAGYVPNNCRWVLLAINMLKGEGSDADMFEIAQALIDIRKLIE